ncbi:carbohydrate ABC transporter permease [Paenibacillus apiarius]|uniref:Sugar ABC transporter permease n=1 Tax=Paenibacillus apiarius TaxID=46240 RepID=A0ABT4DMY6_9BACL|nr:sugar ABC transporter permease [Paenibacillus apiarius]MCY9514735.1 sugar ABC transporter permease [Paenibacillus apiarius]MCY9518725.1 sugar ABC transporter permease [Paenibacillus apiarius]MCY9552834.1 sugar ABC transporter permease [Paenibacillus apiarius]MCY9556859.1 sugar ABC transporter permease [Paenibacillus apiarius]MCY9686188.1 sugar ABC transporter permease [Paenibacillus apiarius]
MRAWTNKRAFITAGLTPALVLYTIFVIIPIFWSAYYGFFDWKGIGAARFIGFDNFVEALKDSVFWLSLRNNMIVVAASVFGQVPIALLLALLLKRGTWFQRIVRSAVFMPMVLSSVVIGIIWSNIYHPQTGLLNAALSAAGLEDWRRAWLSEPGIAMWMIAIPIVWNYIGPYLIMFLAALHSIPAELDDAAHLDGAIGLRKLGLITLPLIWDTLKVAIVLCISGSLKAFDLIYVMTNGGPAHATELLASYMYNSTFTIYRFGYGSAVSTLIVMISLLMVAGSQWLMKKEQR